jgi:copper(I)-binding protein
MRAIVIVQLLLLAACSQEALPPLVASEIEVLETLPGMTMSAGYMALTNNSKEPVRITGISSPHYVSIELHETSIEDGIAKMRPVNELVIEAGETARLQRGGMHMMMNGPADEIETITLMLHSDGMILLSINTSKTRTGS